MAFFGDAMSHGLLPGIALASLAGGSLVVGACVSAAVMTLGVHALRRSPRLSQDTGIGVLFVGMLSLGVIIVSRSQSFAVDLTGFLFGDVLAVRPQDLAYLGVALGVALAVSVLGYRPFVALAFDERKAATLGMRPRLAHAVLLGLLALAVVASFHIVGTLLVFGLLIAPRRRPALGARDTGDHGSAACLGALATFLGLLLSWHLHTAAGATIAATAVLQFLVSVLASGALARWRGRTAHRLDAPDPHTEYGHPA
ncbi:zinc ABC transporter permease AztB [Actinomadura keratinilytica]